MVGRLKDSLLLLVLMHCDPTLLVLLLERKLGQHPVLLLFEQALDLRLLFLDCEVKQAECVLKQAALDLIVKR